MVHTIWGKIDNEYIVSLNGDIRSLDRVHLISRKGSSKPYKRILKGGEVKSRETHKGYMRVQMGKGAGRTHYVHRLVLNTFIGESPLQCNHKDLNTTNNKIENLEWVTQSENIQHSIKQGRKLKVNTLEGRNYGCRR